MSINIQDYYIDVNKLFDIVFDSNKKKDLEREITEAYDKTGKGDKLSMVAKTIREVNGEIGDSEANIRYDVMKIILLTALGIEESSNGEVNEVSQNTLLHFNILKEYEK